MPRAEWQAIFTGQGMQRQQARIEMLDGFNSGWIDFEPHGNEHVIGRTAFETVLAALVEQKA
jgi:NAD(P)H dehydrogenase (quinone)